MKKSIQFILIIAVAVLALKHYGLAFLASLGALAFMIFFHELGHFSAAKLSGVAVRRFSIGFGGVIYARRFGNTIYQIAAIPLGGFVKMKGESACSHERLCATQASKQLDEPHVLSTPLERMSGAKSSHDSGADCGVISHTNHPQKVDSRIGKSPQIERCLNSYDAAPLYKKLIILAAGPAANFLLGFIICVALGFFIVSDYAPRVQNSTNAALLANDEILELNGVKIQGFSQISPLLTEQNFLLIKRDGQLLNISAKATLQARKDILGKEQMIYVLGITSSGEEITYKRQMSEALSFGVSKFAQSCTLLLRGLGMLLSGEQPLSQVGGIISINDVTSTAVGMGLASFLAICALISINLGIMNLLPIPVLDGGHILMLLLGAIFGARTQALLQKYGAYVGLALLGALMCLATFNDINRLIN